MRYSKARYLIQIYKKLTELGVPWEKIRGIGWTRVREVLPLVNQENVDSWLHRARRLSTRHLKKAITIERLHARGARQKSAGAEPEGKTSSDGQGQDDGASPAKTPAPWRAGSDRDPEGEVVGTLILRGCPEQVEIVNAAIDQRMKESGFDSRMACLAAICAPHLSCEDTARLELERTEPRP